jgi:hypothetical protein
MYNISLRLTRIITILYPTEEDILARATVLLEFIGKESNDIKSMSDLLPEIDMPNEKDEALIGAQPTPEKSDENEEKPMGEIPKPPKEPPDEIEEEVKQGGDDSDNKTVSRLIPSVLKKIDGMRKGFSS